MIFVTVGTTSFDGLIEEVDKLSIIENWEEKVVCQIGTGLYTPKNCEFFRFKPNIDKFISEANLVITHGGTTVINLLLEGKKFVAIANTDLADNHQYNMLKSLSLIKDISWSDDVSQLSSLIEIEKKQYRMKTSRSSFESLIKDISNYIIE